MNVLRMVTGIAGVMMAVVISASAQGKHRPVLLISLDGMRPDYVTEADAHGLKLPVLHGMMHDGAYAAGVVGVFPTVTYPSHTTLTTGVWPSEHGILNNTRFDPERRLDGAWYWYQPQVKVQTLWGAAHAAGLRSGSVSWPVTADSHVIDWNIPEYWRSTSPSDAQNADDLYLMDAISTPQGEVLRIGQQTGVSYMKGNATTPEADEVRTQYALAILKEHRPQWMTVHLSSLDEDEHLHGPFSAEANATLEKLDAMVGRLAAQERANYPDAVVVVVSDHGFAKVDHTLNLYAAFAEAGLMTIAELPGKAAHATAWKAQPWLAGGMAAIMLHDPADTLTREQVRALLTKLAADPANGIDQVLDEAEARTLGGFPGAAFVVTLRAGWMTGAGLSGPLVRETPGLGTHGYNVRTVPQMRSAFFAVGPGVAKGRNLGVVDMRSIAPTLAHVLGVSLPQATQPLLPIE